MTQPSPNLPPDSITRFLKAWSDGDAQAQDQLFELVYEQLGRLAANRLRAERRDHTLETRALVHEAFLRLVDQRNVHWRDRAHFFAIAARVMRRVLVDHARRHGSFKRGGDLVRLRIDGELGLARAPDPDPDLVALDDALKDLEIRDPELARIVLLRVFGGLTKEEAATVLGTSPRTLARRWRLARAWLYSYLVKGLHDEL